MRALQTRPWTVRLLRRKSSKALVLLLLLAAFIPGAAGALVPVPAPPPTLTAVTINASAGDQNDAHVSGDWASYTSDNTIRYYNFSTNADAQILQPMLPPDATWIWAPGITGATAPAELAEFTFTKSITLGATPTAANILVAADDFAEVQINGTVVGTTGSTTDEQVATAARNALKSFDILPYLTSGRNTITIRGQNGAGAFGMCTNCTYKQHPAAILVGGSITAAGAAVTFASDTSWQAFDGATTLGSAQNVCLTASNPANCPSGATIYGAGGTWGAGQPSLDVLSDVSGSKITFSRVSSASLAVMVFDAATPTVMPVEVDAAPGTARLGSAIGGNTVAYVDGGLGENGEIVLHDLVTHTSSRVTFDIASDQNPSVSPDGSVVAWEKCASSLTNCDIWQAVTTGASWTVGVVSALASPEGNPDTNGALVVYDSYRAGNSDVFWRPVAGGAEVQLQWPGYNRNPNIAGSLIAFEGQPPFSAKPDIFVYDLLTNRLYQITNTPLVTEQLNDITVLPDGRVRTVWATDEGGGQHNVKGATFRLTDTVAPVLTVPATITVDATGPGGAAVTYTATATDDVTANPTVSCLPPSGSTFPIGTTTVACTATDAAGNSSAGSFNVVVLGASDLIAQLTGLVQSFNLKQGIVNSLDSKLQNISAALAAANAGNKVTACSKFDAFINEVQAQSGKALTIGQANQLIAAATQIKTILGCP
jgi:hypothetical protein